MTIGGFRPKASVTVTSANGSIRTLEEFHEDVSKKSEVRREYNNELRAVRGRGKHVKSRGTFMNNTQKASPVFFSGPKLTRWQQVLNIVRRNPERPFTQKELEDELGGNVSLSNAVFALRHSGVLAAESDGRYTRYRLAHDRWLTKMPNDVWKECRRRRRATKQRRLKAEKAVATPAQAPVDAKKAKKEVSGAAKKSVAMTTRDPADIKADAETVAQKIEKYIADEERLQGSLSDVHEEAPVKKTPARKAPAQKTAEPKKSFGETLRAARKAKGISLRKFAAMIDVSPTYLSMVEQDKAPPPVEKRIQAAAEALNQNALMAKKSEDELLALAGRTQKTPVECPGSRIGSIPVTINITLNLTVQDLLAMLRSIPD